MKRKEIIQNPTAIDHDLVARLIAGGKQVHLQFSDHFYEDGILEEIDALCAKHETDLLIRFYGHEQSGFDCRTLQQLPSVKALSLDGLSHAANVNVIRTLPNLKKMGIGIDDLEETEILESSNLHHLEELNLYSCKTSALNLGHLKRFIRLKRLAIDGHTKQIEAVAMLTGLESLNLFSIKKIPLSFVNSLNQLKSLAIHMGGRENLDELNGGNIEALSLIWIHGLRQAGDLARFAHLKSLLIEQISRLPEIHFGGPMPFLRDIKINTCKTLASVTGLTQLKTLESLILYRTAIDFETFIQQRMPSKLSYFGFHTGKSRTDVQIKSALTKKGYHCL